MDGGLHPSKYETSAEKLAYYDGLLRGMSVSDGNKPTLTKIVKGWQEITNARIRERQGIHPDG